MSTPPEIAWFSALCDDDYEFLGVADPALASSWEHCAEIVGAAERNGFDNVLLPSGYTLGIDATAFAAGIATRTSRINLLLAVRMGELWPPQLARQLATIDRMAGGRLTINIISSDLPGAPLPSAPRYQRTREYMEVLRALLDGQPVDFDGEFVSVQLDPPRVGTVSGRCPPFYFGGFSDDAKHTAAVAADVFLTWPDTVAGVAATVDDMRQRAAAAGRELRFGLRSHVIVRPTEAEAIDATRRLVSQLDDNTGAAIRARGARLSFRRRAAASPTTRQRRRQRLRRGRPVDRHRPRPQRRRRGHRGRPRSRRRQARRLPGRRHRRIHPVRLPPPRRMQPRRPARPALNSPPAPLARLDRALATASPTGRAHHSRRRLLPGRLRCGWRLQIGGRRSAGARCRR